MKFLITNSVPLNGGDEALLRAVTESLSHRWPGSQTTVLCKNVEMCRRYLPDLDLAADLEFADSTTLLNTKLTHRRAKRVTSDPHLAPFADWLCAAPARLQVLDLYRETDVVLSAPGGFLHDHYPIEDRLRGLEIAMALGKPTILLAQSIGPFWKPESLNRVPAVFNRLTRICVRDELSKNHLLAMGVQADRIIQTADVAFLWHALAPGLFQPRRGAINTIGVSIRAWPLKDKESVERTISKAVELSEFLLESQERKLLFISTCQGIEGYWDDSSLAVRVVQALPTELRNRCEIDRERYAPRQLIASLARCDAYIGMRLHGCLLSMLGGTAAMGLGYEPKTAEIFRQLGLAKYQIDFTQEADAWIKCAKSFLNDADEIRSRLIWELDDLCRRAGQNINAIEQCLQRRAA